MHARIFPILVFSAMLFITTGTSLAIADYTSCINKVARDVRACERNCMSYPGGSARQTCLENCFDLEEMGDNNCMTKDLGDFMDRKPLRQPGGGSAKHCVEFTRTGKFRSAYFKNVCGRALYVRYCFEERESDEVTVGEQITKRPLPVCPKTLLFRMEPHQTYSGGKGFRPNFWICYENQGFPNIQTGKCE